MLIHAIPFTDLFRFHEVYMVFLKFKLKCFARCGKVWRQHRDFLCWRKRFGRRLCDKLDKQKRKRQIRKPNGTQNVNSISSKSKLIPFEMLETFVHQKKKNSSLNNNVWKQFAWNLNDDKSSVQLNRKKICPRCLLVIFPPTRLNLTPSRQKSLYSIPFEWNPRKVWVIYTFFRHISRLS